MIFVIILYTLIKPMITSWGTRNAMPGRFCNWKLSNLEHFQNQLSVANPVSTLLDIMSCRWICNKSNTKGTTSGVGTTQWQKEKEQRSTIHNTQEPHKKLGWTWTIQKGKQFVLQWRSRRVILVKNAVISHEWRTNRIVITTYETYPWSFVTQILCSYNH
jgi:hypothetical protein